MTPLKTITISGGTRVYYVDVHKDSKDHHYVVETEISTDKDRQQHKQRIFLHEEHIRKMGEALIEMADWIAREKNGEKC